jgi:hypothetical protein
MIIAHSDAVWSGVRARSNSRHDLPCVARFPKLSAPQTNKPEEFRSMLTVRARAAVSFFFILAACSGDSTGPEGAVPPELVADWVSDPACLPDCSFTVYARQNPADSLNLVRFGLGVEMMIRETGQLRMEVRLARDTLLDGMVSARNGQMLVTARGVPTVDTLDYVLANDMLRIDLRSRLSHDLNGDGQKEPIGLRGVFRRR